MKIGDKVRFLNDVGGGVITGFQGKDTVLVSDADGFEIPTLLKDVVVVETDAYNIALKPKKKAKHAAEAPESEESEEAEEADLADLPLSYTPLPQERRGADQLNLSLAFVPAEARRVPNTDFEIYLVNDCNYYLRFALMLTVDGNTALRHEGELAPNTKLLLETVPPAELQLWERPVLQMLAFKRDKPFAPKPPLNMPLRPDLTRCFKLHTFTTGSPFFNQPAWVMPLVVDDLPVRGTGIDAELLQQAMTERTPESQPRPEAAAPQGRRTAKRQADMPIEVDLHAHSLLDTLVGLQPADILDYQLKVASDVLLEHRNHAGQRIVFIHGKGNGVLRKALIQLVQTRFPQARHQDASFREYGFGATLVTL